MSSHQRYKPNPPPSRISIVLRTRAQELAPTDTATALEAARGCPDAWYRVQALSSIADHVDERQVLAILEEAARASALCHDAYGTVAVMSWPIEVAFRRGRIAYAERERARCLALAPEISPRASQAFALQLLWSGCFAADAVHAKPVWKRILELCHPDRSWRAARLYLHVALVQDSRSPGAAAGVIAAMPPGKAKSRLARRFGLI
jgi:hypothetical protein